MTNVELRDSFGPHANADFFGNGVPGLRWFSKRRCGRLGGVRLH